MPQAVPCRHSFAGPCNYTQLRRRRDLHHIGKQVDQKQETAHKASQRLMGKDLQTFKTRCAALASSREEHNQKQAHMFADAVARLTKMPKFVVQRLERIADAAPGLGRSSRVMDVGSGPGTLIPHLQRRGVQDILAVEVTPSMIEAVHENFPSSSPTAGNELQVRTWLGDVQSVPAYQGLFDAAYFNAVFGNVYDQRDELLRTALLLKPGGYIVISHPLGRKWLEEYMHKKDPVMVPHLLPDQAQMEALISDLPLCLHTYVDEEHLYIATLQVPENYELLKGDMGGPMLLSGKVTSGFGRGSRQLGFPTANLPPKPLEHMLTHLPKGVYFGWACLHGQEYPEEDTAVHKMVMNIGRNPTVNPADAETTVEVHILHKFSKDFYGQEMSALACGFIRPEMKFDGIGALIARIKTDAGIASKQLDTDQYERLKKEHFS